MATCTNNVKLNVADSLCNLNYSTVTGVSVPNSISYNYRIDTNFDSVFGVKIPQLNHYIAQNWDDVLKERYKVAQEEEYKEQNKIKARNKRLRSLVKHVHWSGNACIVYWNDGSRTVAHWNPEELFDAEKAILVCMARKLYENTGLYNEVLEKYAPQGDEFFYKQLEEDE